MGIRLCTVDGCERKHKASGYCLVHYYRWFNPLRLLSNKKILKTVRRCTVEGCGEIHKAKGLCVTHYYKQYNKTRPHKPKNPIDWTEVSKRGEELHNEWIKTHSPFPVDPTW